MAGFTTKLIVLTSDEGQKLWSDSQTEHLHNQYIPRIFRKQVGRKNCGIQSAALLLSSACLATDGFNEEVPPITESKMFELPETTHVTTQEQILSEKGLTLQQVADVLQSHGKTVKVRYARESSVEEFRALAKEALQKTLNGCGVIVNYHMAQLGQDAHLGGHHSPLGAYHAQSDRFLIFDTWPDTEECWAKTEELFAAMTDTDKASGLSRGFLIVTGGVA